jgi:hypothetical protein
LRWARTTIASFYTAFFLLAVWIFPLFSAEPKLAPVYQRITHMVPLGFPILLLAPAIILDWLWPKLNAVWPEATLGQKWLEALIVGVVFVGTLVIVQWPFANFLMSPAAGSWIFGADYHPYMASPDWWGVRHLFMPSEAAAVFWRRMAWAVFAATACTRLGIMFGNWMKKVQR